MKTHLLQWLWWQKWIHWNVAWYFNLDLLWMILYVMSYDIMLCMQFVCYLYHLRIFENNTLRRKILLLTSWPFLNYFTSIYVKMSSYNSLLMIYCEILTFRRKIMSSEISWKWQKWLWKTSRKMVYVER